MSESGGPSFVWRAARSLRLTGSARTKEHPVHARGLPAFRQARRTLLLLFSLASYGRLLADGTGTGNGPLPQPNSKRRRSTFFSFRMDNLLVGTASPVSRIGETGRPVRCPASIHFGGKHSGAS